MHRKPLIDLLKVYNPTDIYEISSRQKMLEFIEKNSDCFERSCVYGHITASCFLLSKDASQVLLLQHKKLNLWLQLGGHCDGDGDILAVAIKEAQEESGILNIRAVQENIFDLDIHLIPQIGHEAEHYHFDIRFLLQVVGDEQAQKNHESHALAWFSKDKKALPPYTESLHRMFDKWAKLYLTC